MAIVDIPASTLTAIERKAIGIRELLASSIGHADASLHQIRNIVRGDRAAIATELGPDAAALLTVYAKLKEAIEAAKGMTVEDLPN